MEKSAKIKVALDIAKIELAFQNEEREKRAAELIIANTELDFQNKEKEKLAAALFIADIERAFQIEEKEKRAAELIIANIELAFQNEEKEKRAAELVVANEELAYQSKEKDKRAAELVIVNIELAYQNDEKENRAAELVVANNELAFQNKEKDKRAGELVIAYEKLALQNDELGKRAAELVIANKELAFQNKEKDKRAAELVIASIELAFQNKEKEKRAAELIIANKELAFENKEKEKRASELSIANKELAFQNKEKDNRSAELKIANRELAFQNKEKDKRSAELVIANIELAFQNEEKQKRAGELLISNQELRKAEGQFRLLVESASYAMVLVNDESFITLVNSKTEKLFGYERSELIGMKFGRLIQEQFRYKYYDLSERFFNERDIKTLGGNNELFFIRKDHTPFQVEIDLTPIETAEGHMVLISIFDITDRKIQEAMLKKQMELEIKNKDLQEFTYIASHDLQEPLRNVSGLVQLFGKKYSKLLDEDALTILDLINGSTTRMTMLIKSLLEFSLLGHNTKMSSVDLNVLIGEVIGDLGAMVEQSGAVFEVQNLPTLPVYEFQIRQIFQNLLTNAIKFTRKDIKPKIKITSRKLDDMWLFSIIDNGIGILPEHFETVFGVFERLHSKNAYEGSGIGLASCKKIARLHNGEIWVESIFGEGTSIHFTIGDLIAIPNKLSV